MYSKRPSPSPPTGRARIARELIDSLESADEGIEAMWAEELRRRIEKVESGEVEIEDFETVKRKLRGAARE